MKFPFSFGRSNESAAQSFEVLRIQGESVKVLQSDIANLNNIRSGVLMGGWTAEDNNMVSQIVSRAERLYEERGEDFPADYEELVRHYITSMND